MKEWLVGYHIVTKSTTRVTGDIPLLAIGYKYISQRVLLFIAAEGGGSTEPVVPLFILLS